MTRRVRFEIMVLLVLFGALVGSKAAQYGSSYDFFDPLVDIHHEISRHYVEPLDAEKIEQMKIGAIDGMIAELNDPYTDYLSPKVLESFDEQTRAVFTGVGAEIEKQGEFVVIVTPLEDSPALEAGVKAGDTILAIDGQSAEGLSVEEVQQKIKGPEGTRVKLKVRHADGQEAELEIERRRIQIQTVKGFRRDKDQHWEFMLDPEQGIAYVRLTQFSEPTTEALKAAIESAKAAGMKGLILDLRFNPGGLLEQAVDVADLFLHEGKIVSSKGRNRTEQVAVAKSGNEAGDFPIVVLINESSASASEIVAGALKDNDRAVIIGTRSFGKGSVQEVHALPGGSGAIKVTTAWYYLPSGRNLHKKEGADVWGVDPNDGFYVPMSLEQIEKMHQIRLNSDVLRDSNGAAREAMTAEYLEKELSDPQLAAAYKALSGKLQTGEFKAVGQSNATLLAHLTEKAALERARERLQEDLSRVDERLKQVQDKISGIEAPPRVKAQAKEKTQEAAPAGVAPAN